MRTLSKGRLARATAYVLTLVFAWSVGFTGLLTLPAEAQIVTRAATSQSVAVVPFSNRTELRRETLGEDAAEAVSVELRDRLLLDVLPKADVTLQMSDLGLMAPLTDLELIRLATELDVALVITGEVRGARIVKEPAGRYGEVVLAVRLFDRVARADVNGAVATGKSPSSIDASDELLLQKALEQAAFSAIEQMKSRPTITAMVLWSRGDTVFLNVGSRGGVRSGMQMVAVRGGEPISRVKIDSADELGAYGTVIQGPPLRTGDNLRGVYELPTGPGPERPGVAEAKKKKFETVVLAGAILLGFGAFSHRTRTINEGDVAAPNFRAMNLANGVELGYSGFYSGSTLLTWDGYQGTQRSSLIGYEIWRNGAEFVDFVDLTNGNVNYDIDYEPGIIFLSRTYTIDDVTGLVVLTGEVSDGWDGVEDLAQWYDSHADEVGVTDCPECTDVSYGWFPSGPFPGDVYWYQIRPLTAVQVHTSTGNFWSLSRDSEMSRPTQQLVSVSPPIADFYHWVLVGYEDNIYEIWDILPNPEISGNIATFYFYGSFGADEMIIQLARDPNNLFDPQGLYTQTLPVSPFYEQTVQVDLSNVPGTSSMFWWRLGGRNRRDTYQATPWPAMVQNDYGWVWSMRNNVQLTSAARVAARQEEKRAVDALRSSRARVPRSATVDRLHHAE